jgi:hypothetical protein
MKDNDKDKGTDGPGKHWNPGSVGNYNRGLQKGVVKDVESESRKGGGAKQ